MAKEFVLPDIGEGLVDAEIVRWHVSVGDVVGVDQIIVEIETAKAVVDLPSPHAGTVVRLAAEEGATVNVGEVLIVIGDPDELAAADDGQPVGATPKPAQAIEPAAPRRASVSGATIKAMPVVRRLARDRGIDLSSIAGSGPGGTITREDVEAVVASSDLASTTDDADDERVPLTRLRRTIAEHMERSWREIPHVTVFDHVDATLLLEAHTTLATRLDRRVPLEALLIAVVIPALVEFPEFNASLDGSDLVLHRTYNVAVAVDTPDGLIVPVVRDAGRLDVAGLAARIVDLSERVRDRTATPDDLTGGTFTVSNIGALGGGFGTPIIPHGTTSIIAVGRAAMAPVVAADGTMRAVPLMPLSLSYDHRVVDGGLGQRFLSRVKENLEMPDSLLD